MHQHLKTTALVYNKVLEAYHTIARIPKQNTKWSVEATGGIRYVLDLATSKVAGSMGNGGVNGIARAEAIEAKQQGYYNGSQWAVNTALNMFANGDDVAEIKVQFRRAKSEEDNNFVDDSNEGVPSMPDVDDHE